MSIDGFHGFFRSIENRRILTKKTLASRIELA
jgi:hypothetical protein